MKHYEETTTYKCYEFETNCKKLITALNRMIKIYPEIEQDIRELKNSYEWYNGDFNECDDTTVYGDKQMPTYRFIVEFDGEFCYICMYYFSNDSESNTNKDNGTKGTNKDTETNETPNDSADGNKETSTDNKTPAELKAYINKKYGVNAVYYDTDSILCDSEKQIVNVSYNTQPCYIKAYYDGKEITVPYSEYKCRKYAVEYIHNLYINRVVPYETLFMIYYDKHVETITIEMVFDTPDLLQYNIDDINVGLKTNYYKKVCEGVKRLCSLIDDNHVCVVGFKYTEHTFNYAITKSKYHGVYNFKRGNNNWIQKPTEIARFIYYHTFAHEVELKYWHTIKEGDTK